MDAVSTSDESSSYDAEDDERSWVVDEDDSRGSKPARIAVDPKGDTSYLHLVRSYDNLQVQCSGMPEDTLLFFVNECGIWPEEDPSKNEELVEVAVESTAVCCMDLAMRKTVTSGRLPVLMGSNLVGFIRKTSPAAEELGLRVGARVAAIVKGGGNAKYAWVPPSQLIPVSKHLDPSDVACLLALYLPAFQTLHHGRPRPNRYSRTGLSDKRILITGGASAEAQAMIRLARLAGAAEMYVVAPCDHESILKRHPVQYLDEAGDWVEEVRGRMDIVVDLNFPHDLSSVQEAMAPRGRLTCVHADTASTSKHWTDQLFGLLDYYYLLTTKRATLFNFAESAFTEHAELEEDFRFLLRLLSTRQIRPQIDRYIKLADVPQAHCDMEDQVLVGAIVCEPWRT